MISVPSSFEAVSDPPQKEQPKHVEYTPPDEIFKDIVSHISRIKNLEQTLEQNRKRGKKLGMECFNLLAAAEIVTFDLLIADASLNYQPYSDFNPIKNFVHHCAEVAKINEMAISDPANTDRQGRSPIEQIANHIKFVYETMQQALYFVLGSDLDRNMAPPINQAVLQVIAEEKFQNEPQKPDPVAYIHLPRDQPEQNTAVSTPPTPDFEEKMKNELSGETLTEEIGHLRGLIGTISHQLNDIESLTYEIRNLKRQHQDMSDISTANCPPESIENNPFYNSARNMYSFLKRISEAVRIQATKVPQITALLLDTIENLKESYGKAQETEEETRQFYSKMKEFIIEAENEVKSLTRSVQPYLDTLTRNDNKNQIDMIQNNLEMWNNVIQLFKETLPKLDESSEDHLNLQSSLDMIEQIKEMREPIIEKCLACIKEASNWSITQIAFFNAISDSAKANAMLEAIQEEKEQLHVLERIYSDFKQKFGQEPSPIEHFCFALQHSEEMLLNSLRVQHETITKMAQEADPLDDDEALQEELNRLEEEELAIDNEYEEVQTELSSAKEKAFSILQEREVYRPWMQDATSKFNDRKLNMYKEAVLCPICGQNKREYAFTTCKHFICGECRKASEGKCPVCGRLYKEDEVVRLYFQK